MVPVLRGDGGTADVEAVRKIEIIGGKKFLRCSCDKSSVFTLLPADFSEGGNSLSQKLGMKSLCELCPLARGG